MKVMKKNFLPQMFGALLLTTVVMVAGCSKDEDEAPPAANQNPVITSVTVNPTSVAAGGTVTVSVAASDPNGDALTYAYTVSGGAISGSGASATWTAPSAGGAYSVTVTVTDGKGSSTSGNGALTVTGGTAQITQITGTASFPAGTGGDLGNAKVSIYNTIESWENESPAAFGVVTGSGASVTFTLPVAVPGIYFFDVWKDNDNNGFFSSGDYYGWQGPGNYNDGTQPAQFSIGQGQTLNFTVNMITILGVEEQYPDGTVHCVAPTAIVDVTNPATGKIWMDRNLGAAQVATSSTDQNAYGDLYQWGRRSDGHQCRTSPTINFALSSTDQPVHGSFIQAFNTPYDWRSPQNANLWQGVNGVNNPCPSGYRLPTNTELNAERLSWSNNNAAGAFTSPLKLPKTGHRTESGSFFAVGDFGYYWSSTTPDWGSSGLVFFPDNTGMYGIGRAYGLSVRCLKN
jgi:uncharacterized protein (TIGR02145 family)